MTETLDPVELRRAAMNWLARREYSRHEITRKLQRKFGEDADVEPVLLWLEDHQFLDDARYLDVYLRSAVEKGQGPVRIRQDLQQRGIPKQHVEDKLAEADVDWFARAANLRQRRFGDPPERADQKAKARQLRYLQYRGFTADQCFHALDGNAEE